MVVLSVFYFPFINRSITNTDTKPQEERMIVAWWLTLSMIDELIAVNTEGTSSNISSKFLKE